MVVPASAIAAWIMGTMLLAGSGPVAAAARQVSTVDAVELARLVEPPAYGAFKHTAWRFSTSPDGERFAYVVSRPRLAIDRNEYQLIVAEAKDIRAYLARPQGALPSGRMVASILAQDRNIRVENALRDIHWVGNDALTFLAEDDNGNSQVFLAQVRAGKAEQLTHHASPVLSYDYNQASGQVVFSGEVYSNPVRAAGAAYVVGSTNVGAVAAAFNDKKWLPQVHFYSVGRGGGSEPLGIVSASFLAPLIRISPDGRRVIVEKYFSRDAVPPQWRAKFEAIDRVLAIRDNDNPSDMGVVSTLVVADIANHSAKPLMDAPTGRMIAGFAIDVAWNGNSHIVLANVFMPADQSAGAASKLPVVVEMELVSGAFARVTQVGPPTAGQERVSSVGSISLLTRDDLRLMEATGAQPLRFKKAAGTWQRSSEKVALADELRLTVAETSRTPPEIFAASVDHPLPARITDLNPQLRDLRFNEVQPFQWTDRAGRAWNGALVLPNGRVPGKRYPLVVQTYGFTPDGFLIDGNEGMRSAYAAQPMASHGMMVLMLPQPAGLGGRKLLLAYRTGVEAAIDQLDRQGLVDTSALGVIGFSAMGNVVQDLITFSRYKFAAATIADAWSFSLFGYVSYGAMTEAESFMESQPWGEDLATWVDRDPSLHTDNISAALRIEQYTPYVLPQWDIYMLLRRQKKLVELILFPYGAHQLRRPQERLLSLEGNVDWFNFWLNNVADPNPIKAEQYARWRVLKQRRDEIKEVP